MIETIVVKVGRNAAKHLPAQFFQILKHWHTQGKHILVIHGGGLQISQWSNQLGLTVHKHHGIRITDPQTLAVTQAVLLGAVQPAICEQFSRYNLPVVGLNASDNYLLTGDYIEREKYGEVGKITSVNENWLQTILNDQIAVVAPLAQTLAGNMVNVNADEAAAAIAAKLGADQLVFLTDVPGILKAGNIVPILDRKQAKKMVEKKQIKAGMVPKINAVFSALHAGVKKVFITNDLNDSGTVFHQSPVANAHS